MDADLRLSHIASAIAEPARARMLCSLLDGHARTSTELSAVADVSASTASAHAWSTSPSPSFAVASTTRQNSRLRA